MLSFSARLRASYLISFLVKTDIRNPLRCLQDHKASILIRFLLMRFHERSHLAARLVYYTIFLQTCKYDYYKINPLAAIIENYCE